MIIKPCKSEALKYGYNGFNVDWEPANNVPIKPNETDAQNYAKFLDYFSKEMHAINKTLSVDVATWSKIWNFTAITMTSIDYVIPMNTYTDNYDTWMNNLNYDIKYIDNNSKLVIGLSTLNLSDDQPFTQQQLQMRLNQLKQDNIDKIAIWRIPLQNVWYQLLQGFVA